MAWDPLHSDGPDGPARVAVVGDWHGNTAWAVETIDSLSARGAAAIVHLGDFGFCGRELDTLKYVGAVDRALADRRMRLFWVDGNHEDHARLSAVSLDHTGLRSIGRRIWHLPRGLRWRWHGQVWMALGGAHGVDRARRRVGTSWWAGEFLTAADVERAVRDDPVHGSTVDVMVCHDAPAAAQVPVLRTPCEWPAEDLAMSAKHRSLVQEVVDAVRPGVLYHGHYHCRYEDTITRHDGGSTRVVGLSKDGSSLDEHAVVLDLAQL